MIYSTFQDKQLSLLGFGTMRLPVLSDGSIDEPQVKEMTRYAIEHGVNYFDTAYPYHNSESERVIGRILSEYPRDSFYLATKMPIWEVKEASDVEKIFNKHHLYVMCGMYVCFAWLVWSNGRVQRLVQLVDR